MDCPPPLFSSAWIKWAAATKPAATSRSLQVSGYRIPTRTPEDDGVCKISDMPYDILLKLLQEFIHPCDLTKLLCVSRGLAEIMTPDEFWKGLCAQELGVKVRGLDTPFCYKLEEQGRIR